jgi:CheY-like chemotaxis protein
MLRSLAANSAAAGVPQERPASAFRATAGNLRPAGSRPKLVGPPTRTTEQAVAGGPVPLGRPFALYHRPGAVVLLDDQPDTLERLVRMLPSQWRVVTFASPHSCLNYLQQEPPRWETDFWAQRRIIDDWYENVPLIPRILAYWADHPDRNSLTHVFVCDDLMPGMDGVDLLGELVDWPGYRVLLDSSGDEDQAASACAQGLIDRRLSKQAPDLVTKLTEAVNGFLAMPNATRHQIWSRTLRVEQELLLRLPAIAQDLTNVAWRTWVEWVAIGEPFGILGIDARGVVSWLHLEPTGELAALAEAAGRHGATPADQEDIRRGRCISDYKLQKGLGRGEPASILPAFGVGDGELLAALQRIDLSPRL